MTTNDTFSRAEIDAQIRHLGWDVENLNAVRFEDWRVEAHPR